MLAASRFARVLPYAQWVGYAIQFGYVGYSLYTMYHRYLTLAEADQRNGVSRDVDQYMALVVRPLRRRQVTNNQANNERRDNNENNESNGNNTSGNLVAEEGRQTSSSDVYQPIPSTSRQADMCNNVIGAQESSISEEERDEENKENSTANTSNYHRRHHDHSNNSSKLITIGDSDSSPDVTIIHDSRFAGPIEYPVLDEVDNQLDETLSNASTSLESTDSNRGIIRDMYNECFICARKLDDPNRPVATLPFCMHPFHKTCLDSVIKWHQKCPVCDFHIFSPI